MLDWEKWVRERLEGMGVNLQDENDVIDEIADHLEEAFECFCKEGMSEREATGQALAQVADWKSLKRKIYLARRQEEIVEPRVKQFWVPGLLGFSLFLAFSTIVESASFGWYLGGKLWLVTSHPLVLSLGRGTPVLRFHIESLFLLVFVGATTAGLSRLAGGTLLTSLLSCVSPAVPFAVVYLIATPIGLIVGHPIAYRLVAEEVLYMALGWVLAPGLAQLAGGLIVQRFVSGGSRSPRPVNASLA